jgi:hypothetical protein
VEQRENNLGHLQAGRGAEEAGEEAEAGELYAQDGESRRPRPGLPLLRRGRGDAGIGVLTTARGEGDLRPTYRERSGGRGGGGGSSAGTKAFAKARGSDAIYWARDFPPLLPWKGSVFWSSTHVVDFTSRDRFCSVSKNATDRGLRYCLVSE